MVYRLKNWILLRDLMCSSKETAKYIIEQSFKEMVREMRILVPPLDENMVRNMMANCGCAISQDGFEVCLLTWREGLSPVFRGTGEIPEFEEFLEELDEMLQSIKETMAEKHQL